MAATLEPGTVVTNKAGQMAALLHELNPAYGLSPAAMLSGSRQDSLEFQKQLMAYQPSPAEVQKQLMAYQPSPATCINNSLMHQNGNPSDDALIAALFAAASPPPPPPPVWSGPAYPDVLAQPGQGGLFAYPFPEQTTSPPPKPSWFPAWVGPDSDPTHVPVTPAGGVTLQDFLDAAKLIRETPPPPIPLPFDSPGHPWRVVGNRILFPTPVVFNTFLELYRTDATVQALLPTAKIRGERTGVIMIEFDEPMPPKPPQAPEPPKKKPKRFLDRKVLED